MKSTFIEEIIDEAGTLIMVNHSLDELDCSRGIWLEGRRAMDGPISEVISAYKES